MLHGRQFKVVLLPEEARRRVPNPAPGALASNCSYGRRTDFDTLTHLKMNGIIF
jgi:hypothetical protein